MSSPTKENTDAISSTQSASTRNCEDPTAKTMRSANPSEKPNKRRVLLPSLGARRPLGAIAPVSSASATGGGEAMTMATAARQQQRRDSLDETATQHTHSSASTRSTISGSSHNSNNSLHSSGYSIPGGGRMRMRPTMATNGSSTSAVAKNNDFSMATTNANAEGEHTANSISSAISYSTKSHERVLRYGETMDSFFCLNDSINIGFGGEDNNGHRHRTLCQEICLGDKSSDANVWREALELSLECNADNVVAGGGGSDVGKRLIQLHRRATSRFKLTSEKDTPNQNATLQIWLLYALVLLKYGRDSLCNNVNNDARQTLKHVQRLYFAKNGQEFYEALLSTTAVGTTTAGDVREEGERKKDVDDVVTALQQSIDSGTCVVEIVKCQMNCLEENGLISVSFVKVGNVVGSASVSSGASASVAPVRLISLPSLGSKKPKQQSSLLARGGVDGREKSLANKAVSEESRTSSAVEKDTMKTDGDDSSKISAVPSSYQRTNKRPLKSSSTDYSSSLKRIQNNSSSISAKPSFRAKLESRKKRKTDKATPHPYRTRKSSGLRAILSQTMDEGDETDDSEEDNNSYVMAKRSADSCASAASAVTAKRSSGSCVSAASSSYSRDNVSPKENSNLFQDISPIDQEPTTSVKDMDMDYLLNWDPTKRQQKRVTIAEDAKKEKEASKQAPKKITIKDLGYMMNWDPDPIAKLEEKENEEEDSRSVDDGGCSGEAAAAAGVVVQRPTTAQNNMSTIDEATEGSFTSGGEGDKQHQSQASCSSQESYGKNNINSSESRKERGFVSTDSHHGDNPSRNDDNERSSSTSQENMISTSKLDCSFLPLIENKNIIRVENEPYAKLGVIGKGGSCKVYRALSRDCDVVALKKVKLDGLNKAAIDGYANEIALLKRLKGNPAIIQLYSAEVDLERKSILLVMEVGEVDLNYVLRQQELMSSKQQGSRGGAGRSSLNMNFIRLTWQQMLTAVHSIHEERIIHSDLKPANFLFVRGALKLIDFGIAKAIEREDTTNVYRETLSGTLSYMSPEAIMDTSTNAKGVRVNKCGRPSDIWSLGCILYQMVYGKTPFAHCHGIPQKVLAITNVNHEIHFPDDGVDESAIDAMKLCLQRNPKQRPPIIGENGLLNEHCFLHGRTKSARR